MDYAMAMASTSLQQVVHTLVVMKTVRGTAMEFWSFPVVCVMKACAYLIESK